MFQPPSSGRSGLNHNKPISRSLGNSQSRLSAMPSSPAYGNTTNVNGAQTATRMATGGNYTNNQLGEMMDRSQAEGRYPSWMSKEALSVLATARLNDIDRDGNGAQTAVGGMAPQPAQLPFSSTMQGNGQAAMPVAAAGPAPIYPGGDAPGIATYYRNSAIQGYQGGQQQQMSAMAGDVREATRNAQYMAAEPQATSSTGANQIMARQPADLQNAVTARAANSYNGVVGAMSDPNRLTPDQKSGLARESALRAAGGGPAADPTGLGARFGGALGQQATSDYDAIQNGQAVRLADGSVSRFTGTPESAREAQLKGKVEREAIRDRNNLNVPQEELDRRKAADAATRERSERASAFRDANNGMNYRQYDRFQKTRQNISRAVADGRMDPATAELKLEQETNKAMRRAEGRRSAMGANPQGDARPLPLAAAPAQGPRNIPAQPPEVAAQSAKTMAEQSPVLKSLGITQESDLNTTLIAVAGMKPDQMTSTQKYEAALHLHEFMLSQLESGNPAYQVGENAAANGDDPRISLIGLDALDTKNKDKMVQWFTDLHRQANTSNKPSTASPFGNALPRRTGA